MLAITALVITFNEAENIERTLSRLQFLPRVIVLDSGSTDETLAIAARFSNVDIVHRAFDSFAGQCNHGLGLVETEWVLSLDADYVLSEELIEEIRGLTLGDDLSGYSARFVYVVHGRRLRASLYPARVVLHRTSAGVYVDEGHGHRIAVQGQIQLLRNVIEHDDRKPLSRWFASQRGYAEREADHLLSADPAILTRNDRLRRIGWIVPFVILPYVLFAKGCVLDGRPGLFYALQRLAAEALIATELLDRRLKKREEPPRSPAVTSGIFSKASR